MTHAREHTHEEQDRGQSDNMRGEEKVVGPRSHTRQGEDTKQVKGHQGHHASRVGCLRDVLCKSTSEAPLINCKDSQYHTQDYTEELTHSSR